MGMLANLAQQCTTTKPMSGTELPEGTYVVCVDLAKENFTQKGTQTLHWTLSITEGDYKGRKLYKDSYVTLEALPWLIWDMQCAGFHEDTGELEKQGRNRFNPDSGLNETIYPCLMGKLIRVVVKYKKKDGQTNKYPDVAFKEAVPTTQQKEQTNEVPWK